MARSRAAAERASERRHARSPAWSEGGVEVAFGVEAQFVGVVDCVELPARVVAEGDDGGLGGAVLAFEPPDEGDAFLDGVEAFGVVVDCVGEGARFSCGVVDLGGCCFKGVDVGAQGAGGVRGAPERVDGGADKVCRVGGVVSEGGIGGGAGLTEGVGAGEQVALADEGLLLAVLQRGGLDLAELEGEEVTPLFGAVRRFLQFTERAAGAIGVGDGVRDGAALIVEPGVVVEDSSLPRRSEEGEVRALTVDVYQGVADGADDVGRDGAPVEARDGASLAVDLASENDGAVVVDFEVKVTEGLPNVGFAGDVEDGFDDGRGRSGAHERAVGGASEDELEGVDEEGLSGAGLAGDDVEAGGEGEAGLLDDGQVADGQLDEHRGDYRARASPRPSGRGVRCGWRDRRRASGGPRRGERSRAGVRRGRGRRRRWR